MKLKVTQGRSELKAYKRSLNHALASRDVSESPNMAAQFPNANNLLRAIDKFVSQLDEYHPIAQARRDVIQYERDHPDVDGIRYLLGVTDEWIDELFRQALLFENKRQ